jgi:hypothetical protein
MVTAGATAIDASGRASTTNGARAAPFVRVQDGQLRHNRGMRRIHLLLLLAAMVMMVAGCDLATPARDPAPASGSAMEFHGQRPCADCDGIEAWLRLEQEGKARRYRMIEHYRRAGDERQFDDEGEWQAEGDLLRLRSRDGGERVYVHQPDGSLQARDARGKPLPAAADDVMVPVAFDSMR